MEAHASSSPSKSQVHRPPAPEHRATLSSTPPILQTEARVVSTSSPPSLNMHHPAPESLPRPEPGLQLATASASSPPVAFIPPPPQSFNPLVPPPQPTKSRVLPASTPKAQVILTPAPQARALPENPRSATETHVSSASPSVEHMPAMGLPSAATKPQISSKIPLQPAASTSQYPPDPTLSSS